MEGGGEGVWMETRKEVSGIIKGQHKGFWVGKKLKLFSFLLWQWTHGPTQETKLYRILQHTQFSTSKPGKPKMGELYYYQILVVTYNFANHHHWKKLSRVQQRGSAQYCM